MRCRQESQSPIAENFPSQFPFAEDKLGELEEDETDRKGTSTQTNNDSLRKGPLKQTSSIGQKAKDVLSRQSSSASERING